MTSNFKILIRFTILLLFITKFAYSQNESIEDWELYLDKGIEQALNLARDGKVSESNLLFTEHFETGKNNLGEKHEKVALLLHKWGVALYLNDDYTNSIKKYSKALDIRKQLFGEIHPDVARGFQNIGINYKYQSNYKEAEEHFLKAIEIRKQFEDKEDLAYSYKELGEVFEIKGDYEEAINYYELSTVIFEFIYGKNDIDVGNLYLLIGSTYEQSNQFNEAELNLLKALSIFENIGFIEGQALAYNELGILYQRQSSDFEKGLLYLQKCQGLYKKMDDLPPGAFADLFNNIGIIYRKKGESENALKYLDSSIILYSQSIGSKNPRVAASYDNIGNVYLERSEYSKAISSYQKAVNTLLISELEDSPLSSPALEKVRQIESKPILLEIISDKGIALFKQGEKSGNNTSLESALKHFMLADSLVNIMRREYSAEGSKLHWIKKTRKTYANAIKTCLLLKEKTKESSYDDLAFFLAEKSKAVLLLEGFREIEAKGFAQIPEDLLENEKTLKANIIRLEKAITNHGANPGTDKLASLKDSLLQSQRDFNSFVKILENKYPKFYRFKYETSVTDVKTIQAQLDSKSAIIEYFLDVETSYAFVISKNGFQVIPLPPQPDLTHTVELFRQSLTDKVFFETNFKASINQYNGTGNKIYQNYIEQAIEHIPVSVDRIIIIPDGPLSFVPFETLPVKAYETELDFFSKKYLLNSFTINYSYSGTMFLENIARSKNLSSNLNLLAFAPNYKNHPDLVNLPGAKTEVEKIEGLYSKHRSLFDAEASKENFNKLHNEFDIIHLAMHGIVDLQDDSKSHLSFFNKSGEITGDKDLFSYEIPALDLNARLVVLSACETGVGRYISGEGVMSLARSFMYAGSPSIVMSLWQTNDNATQQIMTDFHSGLLKGKSKDEALRIAKLNYIKSPVDESAHPFYWAPFVSIGDYHPITQNRSGNWIYWLSALIAIFFGGYFWSKLKKAGRH